MNQVMSPLPIAAKFEAFGWAVQEVNGHDLQEIMQALNQARQIEENLVIVAHTVKGKGVSFMEDVADWHGRR